MGRACGRKHDAHLLTVNSPDNYSLFSGTSGHQGAEGCLMCDLTESHVSVGRV